MRTETTWRTIVVTWVLWSLTSLIESPTTMGGDHWLAIQGYEKRENCIEAAMRRGTSGLQIDDLPAKIMKKDRTGKTIAWQTYRCFSSDFNPRPH